MTAPEVVVDARGLRCPLPVIKIAAAARHAATGSLVTVLWTDPAAAHDIPAWARMRGHQIVATVALQEESLDPEDAAEAADLGTAYATTVRIG